MTIERPLKISIYVQSLLNENIYTLDLNSSLAWLSWGGKSVVSVARGGEMLGMSVVPLTAQTAHRLVPR